MTSTIFSLNDLARECDTPLGQILYHRRKGNIPEPTTWGGRLVFDEPQYEAACAFLKGRERYERRKSTR